MLLALQSVILRPNPGPTPPDLRAQTALLLLTVPPPAVTLPTVLATTGYAPFSGVSSQSSAVQLVGQFPSFTVPIAFNAAVAIATRPQLSSYGPSIAQPTSPSTPISIYAGQFAGLPPATNLWCDLGARLIGQPPLPAATPPVFSAVPDYGRLGSSQWVGGVMWAFMNPGVGAPPPPPSSVDTPARWRGTTGLRGNDIHSSV